MTVRGRLKPPRLNILELLFEAALVVPDDLWRGAGKGLEAVLFPLISRDAFEGSMTADGVPEVAVCTRR